MVKEVTLRFTTIIHSFSLNLYKKRFTLHPERWSHYIKTLERNPWDITSFFSFIVPQPRTEVPRVLLHQFWLFTLVCFIINVLIMKSRQFVEFTVTGTSWFLFYNVINKKVILPQRDTSLNSLFNKLGLLYLYLWNRMYKSLYKRVNLIDGILRYVERKLIL